jgi:hypothetical protein
MTRPKVAAFCAALVEKFVDYFLKDRNLGQYSSLANSRAILIEDATSYLSNRSVPG